MVSWDDYSGFFFAQNVLHVRRRANPNLKVCQVRAEEVNLGLVMCDGHTA